MDQHGVSCLKVVRVNEYRDTHGRRVRLSKQSATGLPDGQPKRGKVWVPTDAFLPCWCRRSLRHGLSLGRARMPSIRLACTRTWFDFFAACYANDACMDSKYMSCIRSSLYSSKFGAGSKYVPFFLVKLLCLFFSGPPPMCKDDSFDDSFALGRR